MPYPINNRDSTLVPYRVQQPVATTVAGLPSFSRVMNVSSSPAQASLSLPALTSLSLPRLPPVQRAFSLPERLNTAIPSSSTRQLKLPEIRTSELNINSPGILSYTQNMLHSTPVLVERIFQETVQLHKNTLQNLIRKKDYGLTDYTRVAQAQRHLLIKTNPERITAFEQKVTKNKNISAHDRNRLLYRIDIAKSWMQSLERKGAPTPRVSLPALAAALNNDLIEMLIKLGATESQLHEFVSARRIADSIIKYDLFVADREHIDEKLRSLEPDIYVPVSLKYEVESLITAFAKKMYFAEEYLDSNVYPRIEDENDIIQYAFDQSGPEENFDTMSPLADFANHPVAGVSQEEVIRKRTSRLLMINFMRSDSLSSLFKQSYWYSPAFMERSVINPEQLHLSTNSDKLKTLNKLFDPPYAKRARRLMSMMDVAPFIFGDSDSPPAINLEGLPCGYRGLPFSTINGWLTKKDISPQRLEYIGLYCNKRLSEITHTGKIDLAWMESLSDATLGCLFVKQYDLFCPGYREHQFVFSRVLNEIGKITIRPDFDYQHLPEFIKWVRKVVPYAASDNDLAYLLFQHAPVDIELVNKFINYPDSVGLSLITIAAKVARAANPGDGFIYSKEKAVYELRQVIKKIITPQTLREVQRPEQLRQQVNNLLPQQKVLAFIAQHYNVDVIQENALDEFQQGFDPSGRVYTTPPAAPTSALILRPGELTPVNQDGSLQETIDLEYGDNHYLLRTVLSYFRRREGLRPDAVQFEQALLSLEQELTKSAGIR